MQELIDGKRIEEAVEQKVVQKAFGSRKQFKRMSTPCQISALSNSGAEYLFAGFHSMAGAYFSMSVVDAVAQTETPRQNPQILRTRDYICQVSLPGSHASSGCVAYYFAFPRLLKFTT